MAALAAHCARVAAQLVPIGDEFQVNLQTVSSQNDPDVAGDASGNFVVVWASYGQDGDYWGVFARRYDSNGGSIGGDFQVNTYTPGYQYRPAVGTAPNGDFVIAWETVATYGSPLGQDGSQSGIFAQRFDSSGTRRGSEFQVNAQTLGYQGVPSLAVDDAGNFAVAWRAPDGDYEGVFARRFASSGAALGTEFQVNTYTLNTESPSDVVMAAGGLLVVFDVFGEDGDSGAVFARRYDGSGAALGAEFQVNTYTVGGQGSATGSAAPDGSFTIAWHDASGRDGSSFAVFAERYDSAGSPLGAEFQVNSFTVGLQASPGLAVLPSGDFVLAWEGTSQGNQDIFARAFDRDGVAGGDDVRVNQYPFDTQLRPEVAVGGADDILVVWQSQTQDGQFGGVFARRFAVAGTPISGRRLLLQTPPSGPSHNKLVFLSTDSGLETPERSGEDPRCPPAGSGSLASGATLRVVGAGGDFTIDLPCLNWSANSSGTRFKYRDGTGATCKSILIRSGRLMKATCKGPQVAYALGAPQGDVHLILSTGDPATHRKYCATFGPLSSATVLRDGSDGKTFKALNAGPGVCP